jgi:hypothetical protein
MASLNNSHNTFGSTASNLRKLKGILNASLVGSQESVILTNETVRFASSKSFPLLLESFLHALSNTC